MYKIYIIYKIYKKHNGMKNLKNLCPQYEISGMTFGSSNEIL
jgi:hypothetical protein